jgi:hypothetical protein
MPTRLEAVVFDAGEPSPLARFWSDALGWPVTFEDADEVVVEAEGEPFLPLVFVPVSEPKRGKNRVHLDLGTSSPSHQAAEVERLRDLGARPADIGQGDVPWVVLADPEDNEFCVLDPRPEYADTGPVAAVVVDCPDPHALAPFWVEAAGWTVSGRHAGDGASLRRPDGRGPFLELLTSTDEKTVKNRIHLDVAPYERDDQAAEVERLRRAGARPIDIGQGEVSWVVMADPQGNEFCVLSPR